MKTVIKKQRPGSLPPLIQLSAQRPLTESLHSVVLSCTQLHQNIFVTVLAWFNESLSLTPRFSEVLLDQFYSAAVSTASRAIRLNPSISDQIRVTFLVALLPQAVKKSEIHNPPKTPEI
jgi:hypothetical protein